MLMSFSRSGGMRPCVDIPQPQTRRRRLAAVAVIIFVVGSSLPPWEDHRAHLHNGLVVATAALGVELVREIASETARRISRWVRDSITVLTVAVTGTSRTVES
ncbi:hypothetical protein Ade02nite_40050 [Paractinoplanes deccanensis]|uniref:Uncharacterized protein n=1 Tax=Paractinoplanes deccanensis TaxID=113561 RepID=A0ABQ3Y5U6_9ACTN|nr:hypothetical protein Ade02nite_40050 [Actinoplanes deccanensis]